MCRLFISHYPKTLLRWWQWFHVPDHVRIFLDATITAKKAHPADADNTFGDPFLLILVCLIHQSMGLDVTIEIIRDQIVVTMVNDGIAKRGEAIGIPKFPTFDGIEDFGKIRVKSERAKVMGMA